MLFRSGYNYLIGSGDILQLKFSDLDVYNGEFKVLNDGWIFLPVIGNYFIENKTLEEARNDLISKYSKELIVPDLQLNLSYSRPLDISIIGEVQKPGLYQIKDILGNPPKLVDGLQLAGGITSKSNLEDVKLIRVFKEDGGIVCADLLLLHPPKKSTKCTENTPLRTGAGSLLVKGHPELLNVLSGNVRRTFAAVLIQQAKVAAVGGKGIVA